MSKAPRLLATHIRPIALLIAVTTICVAVGSSHVAQRAFALTNGGSITALGVPLTENFDALALTGTNISWVDNSTIPGWYSNRATYNSGTGSSNTGALYSFGVAGTNPDTDRALGSVASGVPARSSTRPGLRIIPAQRLLRLTSATSASSGETGQRHRPRSHLPIPGRERRRHNRRQYSDERVDDFCPVELHGPIATATAAALDGNAAANRTADISDAHGHGQRRSGDLGAVAGS